MRRGPVWLISVRDHGGGGSVRRGGMRLGGVGALRGRWGNVGRRGGGHGRGGRLLHGRVRRRGGDRGGQRGRPRGGVGRVQQSRGRWPFFRCLPCGKDPGRIGCGHWPGPLGHHRGTGGPERVHRLRGRGREGRVRLLQRLAAPRRSYIFDVRNLVASPGREPPLRGYVLFLAGCPLDDRHARDGRGRDVAGGHAGDVVSERLRAGGRRVEGPAGG